MAEIDGPSSLCGEEEEREVRNAKNFGIRWRLLMWYTNVENFMLRYHSRFMDGISRFR